MHTLIIYLNKQQIIIYTRIIHNRDSYPDFSPIKLALENGTRIFTDLSKSAVDDQKALAFLVIITALSKTKDIFLLALLSDWLLCTKSLMAQL